MDFKFKIFCLSISVFTKSSQAQVTNSLSLAQLAWDVSERSQSNLHWERHLRDILETSHKRYLFVTSLRRLKYFSEKMSFMWHPWDFSKTSLKRCLLCDVFKTSRAYLKKYVFPVFLASICGFSKTPYKNDIVWFR